MTQEYLERFFDSVEDCERFVSKQSLAKRETADGGCIGCLEKETQDRWLFTLSLSADRLVGDYVSPFAPTDDNVSTFNRGVADLAQRLRIFVATGDFERVPQQPSPFAELTHPDALVPEWEPVHQLGESTTYVDRAGVIVRASGVLAWVRYQLHTARHDKVNDKPVAEMWNCEEFDLVARKLRVHRIVFKYTDGSQGEPVRPSQEWTSVKGGSEHTLEYLRSLLVADAEQTLTWDEDSGTGALPGSGNCGSWLSTAEANSPSDGRTSGEQSSVNVLPIFGKESRLPAGVAGLRLAGVDYYPEQALGVGIKFHGPGTNATVYLYNFGLTDVPADLRSDQVVGWFRSACNDVARAAGEGVYQDLELRTSQYLAVDAGATEPLGLWAAFAYAQAPAASEEAAQRRVSHVFLRTDRGYINKVRYTHPDTEDDQALHRFMAFVAEWTAIVQSIPALTSGVEEERLGGAGMPWIDYDGVAEQFESEASQPPSGLEVPDGYTYMRYKAFRYLSLGPHLYRSQDALSRPPPWWSPDRMAELAPGCEQLLAWKGLTPDTAFEELSASTLDDLCRLCHFDIQEGSIIHVEGKPLLRVTARHEMYPDRAVTLYAATSPNVARE